MLEAKPTLTAASFNDADWHSQATFGRGARGRLVARFATIASAVVLFVSRKFVAIAGLS